MPKTSATKRDWIKPELMRLGKMRDVASSPPTGPQGGGGKS